MDLEARVREMTKSLPPSDLNSHRAIMAIVEFARKEIESCAAVLLDDASLLTAKYGDAGGHLQDMVLAEAQRLRDRAERILKIGE